MRAAICSDLAAVEYAEATHPPIFVITVALRKLSRYPGELQAK
jgi:hypothetical protein